MTEMAEMAEMTEMTEMTEVAELTEMTRVEPEPRHRRTATQQEEVRGSYPEYRRLARPIGCS